MVMLAPDVSVTTVDQLFALPEDNLRHELLRGEHVVTPSPSRPHQWAAAVLARHLSVFTVKQSSLTMLFAPSDVRLEEHSLVQPDIFVLRGEFPGSIKAGYELEAPELVVEIISPGTAGRDRGKKREIYQDAGVAEYWIVDLGSRLIERWRPGDERPEILRESIQWQPDEDGDVLTIELGELWVEEEG